jgi:YcxB-like protein
MEPQTFHLTYRLVPADLLAMLRNRRRHRSKVTAGLRIALHILILGMGVFALSEWWKTGGWFDLGIAAFLLLSPLLVPLAERLSYRRVFDKQRLGTTDIRFAAGIAGVDVEAATGRSHFPWTAVSRVDASTEHVFLWLHSYMAIIVPKRVFASPAQAEAFVSFAKSHASGPAL